MRPDGRATAVAWGTARPRPRLGFVPEWVDRVLCRMELRSIDRRVTRLARRAARGRRLDPDEVVETALRIARATDDVGRAIATLSRRIGSEDGPAPDHGLVAHLEGMRSAAVDDLDRLGALRWRVGGLGG